MPVKFSRTAVQAHPRSRGENILPALEPLGGVGSSPLTRGKLRLTRFASVRTRLIPAHAGKTVARTSAPETIRAHPRSRGENFKMLYRARVARGSSPLTRGKPILACDANDVEGLIPAHAGKT